MSTFEFILSKNVSPNFYSPPSLEFIENFYDAPLVYASLNGNIEMVNLLHSKKACVNVKYCNIQRFYTACKLNSLEYVKAFLEKNPTIDLFNGPEKLTPLDAFFFFCGSGLFVRTRRVKEKRFFALNGFWALFCLLENSLIIVQLGCWLLELESIKRNQV